MVTTTAASLTRTRTVVDLGLLAALASAAAFASSGPFGKALLATGWSSGSLVLARVGLAGLVLLGPAVVALRGRWHVLRDNAGLVLAFGALAVAGCQVAYFNAVTRVPVAVALLLEYLGVVLVVLWVWARSGRRPSATTFLGVALSLGGLALVLDVVGGVRVDAVGVAWGLLAAIGLAAYFVLAARASTGLPAVAFACFGMLVGAAGLAIAQVLGLVPVGIAMEDVWLRGATMPWWVAVLELALVAAAAAYLLGTVGTRRLGSTVASFVGLSEVLFAVVLAFVLLGELPQPIQLVGGLLIVAGVIAVRVGELRRGQ